MTVFSRGTRCSLVFATLLGGGCGSSVLVADDMGSAGGDMAAQPDLAPPAGFCAGTTSLIYDPLANAVGAFPDDFYTIEDATTPTQLRVNMTVGQNVTLPATFMAFAKVFADLSVLDGFGTTTPLYLRLSGAIDPRTMPVSGEGSGKSGASLMLINLDDPNKPLVDIEWISVAESKADPSETLVVYPMLPLAPKTRYALVLTNGAKDVNGGCIAPSPTMAELLGGTATDPALTRLASRYRDLVSAARSAGGVTDASQISAGIVFTTEHTVEDDIAIAGDIRKRKFSFTRVGPCAKPVSGEDCYGTDMSGYRCLEGTFNAVDYRKDKLYLDDTNLTNAAAYAKELPVTVYLPATGTGPFPTMIYGHGLGGTRHQACRLAEFAAPKGFATVAIDAVKHGNHPDQAVKALGGKLDVILDFFGFSVVPKIGLDARKMRDNWRQSAYDKLELMELLRGGVDSDGDQMPELNIDHLVYLGVSLGGIMSAEFLAFAPEVKAAVPIVPGARVTEIVQDGSQFSAVIGLFRASASDGDIARFFPLLQSAIDRGDAGAYTRHIVKQRLPGFDSATPQVLMQMVIKDDTVPNSTNRFFARGLGVPHVGDELQKIGLLPLQPASPTPVKANIDGTHTSGVFQYDVVWDTAKPCCDLTVGKTMPASHGNVAANPVAIDQSLHFLSPIVNGTVMGDHTAFEIIDPYRDLKIKP